MTPEQLLQMAIVALLEDGKKVHEIGEMFRRNLPDVWHAWKAGLEDEEESK